MAIKHNNVLPRNHFRKDWQSRVKTWFNQPGKKLRRRRARVEKASKLAPRPTDALRPVVHCPTAKYNMKVRAGRGFSLEELKAAGIPRQFAKTIGIAVDHRRQNRSQESIDANVERLNAYKSQLILFPRKHGKSKKGDSDASTIAEAKQVSVAATFPISQPKADLTPRAITSEEKEGSRYHGTYLDYTDLLVSDALQICEWLDPTRDWRASVQLPRRRHRRMQTQRQRRLKRILLEVDEAPNIAFSFLLFSVWPKTNIFKPSEFAPLYRSHRVHEIFHTLSI